MLMFGYLRRADDAYTGNERKRKALIRGYSNKGCAHGSARFALQGVRRSRPRWELFGLISLGKVLRANRVRFLLVVGEVGEVFHFCPNLKFA